MPEDKRLAVLNAAIEVFGKYDYKRASTDLIAVKAGISKGLLFYYFRNKRELYLAAFEYARQTTIDFIMDARMGEITDFFEMLAYAGKKKFRLMAENPHVVDFALRSYYSEKEEVSEDLKAFSLREINGSYETYFQKIDFGKFKDGANPQRILKMLLWMMDGYLHEQQMLGKSLRIPEIEEELDRWMDMFKAIFYREEYL